MHLVLSCVPPDHSCHVLSCVQEHIWYTAEYMTGVVNVMWYTAEYMTGVVRWYTA